MNNLETTVKKFDTTGYEPKAPSKKPKHSSILKDDLYHSDRILGAVVGNAVGDALGAPAEFQSRQSLFSKYPDGLRVMTAGGLTGGKIAGSYTDDTEMLVAIAKGVIDTGDYNLGAIARRFVDWRDKGPADIGGQTSSAISAMKYKDLPLGDAGYATLRDGSEGNGSLMRNGIIFVLTRSASLSEALSVADNVSALTHASHQCRSSCAAMTFLQRALCGSDDPKKAVERTYSFMKSYGAHAKVLAAFERVIEQDYTEASKMPTSGYVIDTLERAVWCLYQDLGFEEGIVTCIMQGGDADSAGAVCGSLLGTYYGYKAIPTDYLEAIRASEAKHRDCKLEELTPQVAEIGDKYFSARRR